MATRLWIFIQLAALCSGARPSEETLTESALGRLGKPGRKGPAKEGGASVTALGRMIRQKGSSPEKGSEDHWRKPRALSGQGQGSASHKVEANERSSPEKGSEDRWRMPKILSGQWHGSASHKVEDDEEPSNAVVPYGHHNASSVEKEASDRNMSATAHFWNGFHGTHGAPLDGIPSQKTASDHWQEAGGRIDELATRSQKTAADHWNEAGGRIDELATRSQKTAGDHWHEAGGSLIPSLPSLRLSGPLDIGMTNTLDAPDVQGLKSYKVRNTEGWSDKEGVSYRKTPDLGDTSKDTDAGLVLWDKTVTGRETDDGKFIEVDIQDEAGAEPKLRYLPKVVPGDEDADPPEPDHEILFEDSPAFGLEGHAAAMHDAFHTGLETTSAMRDALHAGLHGQAAEMREALAMYRDHKKDAQETIRAAKGLAAHFSKGEPRLDDFIGETHAAETNAEYPSPATYFKGFDNFYNAQYGLKEAVKPVLEHAQDLSNRAVGSYNSMKQLSGVIEKTVPVLNSVEAKADQARLKVDEESHEVVDGSLNAFGALRKYEANRGSIDDYYDAGKLSEKALLLEGQRHAESGKWDFFANEGFPSRYPQVKLDKLDTPQEHPLFSKVRNNVEAQTAGQVALPTPENINENMAIAAHRPLSQHLDGRESSFGAEGIPGRPAEASRVEAEGMPGETRPKTKWLGGYDYAVAQTGNDGVEDEMVG